MPARELDPMSERRPCDRCGDLVDRDSLTGLWDMRRYCRGCLERADAAELATRVGHVPRIELRQVTTAVTVTGWVAMGVLVLVFLGISVNNPSAAPLMLFPLLIVAFYYSYLNTRLIFEQGNIRVEYPMSNDRQFTPDRIVSWSLQRGQSFVPSHGRAITYTKGEGLLRVRDRVELFGERADLELLGATLRVIAPGKERGR